MMYACYIAGMFIYIRLCTAWFDCVQSCTAVYSSILLVYSAERTLNQFWVMSVKSLSNIYSQRRLDMLHVTAPDSYHHVTCDRGAPLRQAWTLEHRQLSYWSRSWVGANQLAAWVHTAVSVARGSVRLLHRTALEGRNAPAPHGGQGRWERSGSSGIWTVILKWA